MAILGRPAMNETELQVVCRSCGREVSPYVTECPYCGTRLRKKAPKLERDESGSLGAARKPSRKIRPRISLPRPDTGGRPLGSIAIAVLPAILLLAGTAFGLDRIDLGAVGVPSPAEFWRFLAAPFVYDDPGYLFAIGLAVILFGSQLEERIGTIALVLLLLACGSLGTLGAFAIDDQRGFDTILSGGSGVALGAITASWVSGRRAAAARGDRLDWIPFLVAGIVVAAMPLVVATASIWVGPVGGAVGALAALAIRDGVRE